MIFFKDKHDQLLEKIFLNCNHPKRWFPCFFMLEVILKFYFVLKENEDDTFNGRNNIITVNESDFDFTEALMKDETAEKVQSGSFSSLTSKPSK